MGTLHSSVQVVGDSWEDIMDAFGVAVFKFVLVIAEHFVVLHQKITHSARWSSTSLFVSIYLPARFKQPLLQLCCTATAIITQTLYIIL